ncbi:meiotic cell cortex C-terminal pleckstrin homology-domain-containing protein [Triangularia verruculosa]|uniref:Meiotic cell cortex C-terminal pleckstrin homology-domain-containing protein n=1 Tax=Triangularia verruculosa TaxID=2587418 RepID=A0AAN7AX91_9PEZI|nr:meiotic cell cortex C-terminal pleckstrin homology-domain-containing protein [Triangularia verruculosa]
MVGVWETEDESTVPVGSLPTPADTPYRIPSRNVSRGSRKSKRSVTPPGKNGKSRSPAPLNGERNDRASMMSAREFCSDEPVSIDSKRFTPTLHANLVSEILSLRRDQEDKLKIIESLESSLEAVRGESESLQARVVSTDKESRSLKRQLALLEGGTSSALGELARERDEAVDSVAETKKRLDITQKKLRSQEEDSERVHRQWEKEKNEWEEEKRKLERKIHVAESRLKVVIDEVTAFQPVQVHGENGLLHDHESEGEESVKDNDAASVRTMSLTSTARFSIASPKANGMSSLADELDGFDEESDYGGRESVMSNGPHHAHFRNMSRDSIMSKSHRRRQSNDSLMRSGSVARSRLVFSPTALERLEGSTIQEDDETESITPKAVYVDTGVQPSPPPSPKVAAVTPATPEPSKFMQRYERLYGDLDSPPRADLEIEANQRRKRVQIGQPLAIKTSANNLMVNGSSQTQEEPLSPPKTPKTPFQELPPTPKPQIPAMVSSSTQTEDIAQPLQLPVLSIPSISIIPPSSRPSTPRQPLLPQLTKDFGCQVSLISSPPTSSSSMQTEEIRVDKRLAKLPPHLQPSAITSRPVSPALPTPDLPTDDFRQFTPVPGNVPPPRNPRRLTSKRSIVDIPSSPPVVSSPATEEARDAYPGNNDDGPVSNQTAAIRRPHRISSLFAGFDGNSTDEGDEFMDLDISDSEYRTALSAPSAPRTVESSSRMGKRGSETTAASSDSAFSPKVSSRYSPRLMDEPDGYGGYGSANIISQTRETRDTGINSSGSRRGGPRPAFGTKASVMRRAALIQSGINSHSRARSPSLTDTKEPPFPIPTRASSRKPPLSGSAPSEGRSPSRGSDAWHRRGSSRSHYRAGSIRKVRSATGLPRGQRRQPSRSPSRFAESVEAPESPSLPPLPTNDITTPRNKESTSYAKYRSHRSQPSTANTATTGETGGASQAEPKEKAFTVVEAIAQTMVGEWMYKYVRRRKSFGMSDAKGGDDTSNDRHKRWVWLQPYDRCILWSSKQPTTGGALLGKSGRKRTFSRINILFRTDTNPSSVTIQSVIDVKDDNPPPRGAGQLFNRSILILTPQRALKFTASSAERHYIWLNSLSFLAHSNQAIPESLPVPQAQPKPSPEQYELPKAKVRRPIRDSIRLTKARTGAPVIKSDPMEPPQLEIDSAPPAIGGYRPPMPDIYSIPSHTREESTDTAAPPPITRYGERGVHGRKRSNTGGHVPPPLSFRGFSGPIGGAGYHASTNSTAGNSIAGSSDVYSNAGASAVTGASSAAITWGTGSVRTSEASNRPNGPNFFDAIGTVRMEAFISPLAFSRFGDTPYEDSNERDDDYRRAARRRSKELRRRASRSRQRDSYHSRGTRATTEEVDEWYSKDTRDDPFRGF